MLAFGTKDSSISSPGGNQIVLPCHFGLVEQIRLLESKMFFRIDAAFSETASPLHDLIFGYIEESYFERTWPVIVSVKTIF